MTNQVKTRALIAIAALALEAWALYTISLSPAHWHPAMIVKDEPKAHALYDAMTNAMWEAKSLSYTAVSSGPDDRATTYNIYLKKPYAWRVEVTNNLTERTTMLVGDGDNLWIYWSGNRLAWKIDTVNSYKETRSDVFIKKVVSAACCSISNEIASLGMAWSNLILDPSLFHGNADPYAPLIDGIQSKGTDTVGCDVCDVIEIGFMKAQRTRYIWLSRQDYLPRRIKEINRLADNHVTVVQWSNVTLNPDISPAILTWSPPETSKPWHLPQPEASLLKNGQAAPDFTLRSIDGDTISLSDYRDSIVWLYVWQAGSPSCRKYMPHLQSLYESYRDKGLVILGLNVTDNKQIAKFFLKNNSITFPIILDSSTTAQKIVTERYGNRTSNVPLSYIIDKQGNIVDAWFGFEKQYSRTLTAIETAGVRIEKRVP